MRRNGIVHWTIGNSKLKKNISFPFLSGGFHGYRARKCVWKLPRNTRYTCGHLEDAINCYESVHPDCAKLIPAGSGVVDYDPRKGEIRSSDTCYDQKFDQYFNEDGMCSFADFKE